MLTKVFVDPDPFISDRFQQIPRSAFLSAQSTGQCIPCRSQKPASAQSFRLVKQQRGVDQRIIFNIFRQTNDFLEDVMVTGVGLQQQFRQRQFRHHIVGFESPQPLQTSDGTFPALLSLIGFHQAQQYAPKIRDNMCGHLIDNGEAHCGVVFRILCHFLKLCKKGVIHEKYNELRYGGSRRGAA